MTGVIAVNVYFTVTLATHDLRSGPMSVAHHAPVESSMDRQTPALVRHDEVGSIPRAVAWPAARVFTSLGTWLITAVRTPILAALLTALRA